MQAAGSTGAVLGFLLRAAQFFLAVEEEETACVSQHASVGHKLVLSRAHPAGQDRILVGVWVQSTRGVQGMAGVALPSVCPNSPSLPLFSPGATIRLKAELGALHLCCVQPR